MIALSEAIFVTYLVGIATVGTLMSLVASIKFHHTMKKNSVLHIVTICQTYFGLACALTLFAIAPGFGDNVECNTQVKLVVFAPFPALPDGRWFVLAFLSVTTIIYTISLGYDYYIFGKKRPKGKGGRDVEAAKKAKAKEREGVRYDGALIAQVVAIIVIFGVLLANAELFCRENNFYGQAQQWGFGQILPMFLVIQPLCAVISGFWEHGLTPYRKPSKETPKSKNEPLRANSSDSARTLNHQRSPTSPSPSSSRPPHTAHLASHALPLHNPYPQPHGNSRYPRMAMPTPMIRAPVRHPTEPPPRAASRSPAPAYSPFHLSPPQQNLPPLTHMPGPRSPPSTHALLPPGGSSLSVATTKFGGESAE
ncbi:hypothetical protein BOTBODRAFT_189096 [Botryobasidium botryosum FD-172 SS1]|uniref:Uncharacterized protein n=1 Tax=Botryobasidium botryosum (strain FD-172 SS1) TaxID=930990 RepID=A0A067MAH8_BOTB1|nr:hypothetical protein BOTBODRAFT_189096 [Botryobasidium botryosum FD-172 SS1]